MREKGVDISGQRSKGFDELPHAMFDYVVTMGCGDACPTVSARKRLDWQIPDPKGNPPGFFRQTRDLIAEQVQELIREIGA